MALAGFAGAFAGGASVQVVISAVDDFSKTIAKADMSFKSLGGAIGKFGVAAAGAIAGFTAYAVSQFAEAEAINKRLAFSFGELSDEASDAAQSIADSSIRTKEEISQSFVETKGLFDAVGLSFDQQASLIKRASEIAGATGKEFGDVLNTLTAVMNGKVGPAARELGIILEDGIPKGATAAQKALLGYDAIQKDTARFIGGDESEKESFIGRLATLKKTTNDLAQAFGEGFVTSLTDASGSMKSFSEQLKGYDDEMKSLGKSVAGVTSLIVTGILGAVGLIEDLATGVFRWTSTLYNFLAYLQDGIGVTEAWGYAVEATSTQMENSNIILEMENEKLKTNADVKKFNADMTAQQKTILEGTSNQIAKESEQVHENTRAWHANADARARSGSGTSSNRSSSSSVSFNPATMSNEYYQENYTSASGKKGAYVITTKGNAMSFGTKKRRDAAIFQSAGGEVFEFDPADNISLTATKKGGGMASGTVVNVHVAGNVWSMNELVDTVDRAIAERLRDKIAIGLK